MAKVALNGATNNDSVASGHVGYRYITGYNWYYGYPYYGNGTTSATIRGTCNASQSTVFVNGVNPVKNGDTTTENDTAGSMPSSADQITGVHSGSTGSVTNGNNRNVFVGGVSVAIEGSAVKTHANTNTSIKSGGSDNVFIGG